MKKITFLVSRLSIIFILFILIADEQAFAQQDTIEKYYATHTSATWCANPDSLHDKGLYRESIESLKTDTLIKNFIPLSRRPIETTTLPPCTTQW